MQSRTFFAVAIAFLATLGGFERDARAGLILSITPDQFYLDYAGFFPYVGYVEATDSGGNNAFRQSAVLIDPHFALTSVHGLLDDDNNVNSAYSNISLGFGSNFITNRGEVKSITAFDLHPSYNGLRQGYDIALLYSEEAFISIPTTANLFTGDTSTLRFQDSHIAGFGETGNEITGPTGIDGNMRAGISVISTLNPLGSATPNFIGSSFRPGGGLLGSDFAIAYGGGDSGGGFFVDVNGEFKLVGINALGPGDGSLLSVNIASLVDHEWISTTKASRLSSVPEPSSLVLGLMGSGLMMLRRDRRKVA